MEDINKYMEEFKTYSIDDKRQIALEQLKLISSLSNIMCQELNVQNEVTVTKDTLEAHKNSTEDDFVEGVVVYASSIQNSLCDFIDKLNELLENKAGE